MKWAYLSYGLHLLADGEIPGLTGGPDAPAEVRIWLNKMPVSGFSGGRTSWYESRSLNPDGRPNLIIWRTEPEGAFHFVYDDRTEFLIQRDGRQVWCSWSESATAADAAVYLRGPVLGFVLRLHGFVCLHASAVAVGQSAIAVLGYAGAGKSTTAAGFVELGFPLLADDVTVLRTKGGSLQVQPGYPRLNLWPDAGEALYGSAAKLPRVTPSGGINDWWDKRYVALETEGEYCSTPLPLAAVYVLGERASDERAPRVEAMSVKDALTALTVGTYTNYALDESMRATEFRTLGRLIRTTPVRWVTAHDNPARPLELCDTILSDYGALTARSLARS